MVRGQLMTIVMLATLPSVYLPVLIITILRKVVIKHQRVLSIQVALVVAVQPLVVVSIQAVLLEEEVLAVVDSIQVEPLVTVAKHL